MRADLAMGTFLRVWRREWAGLSRAQLARSIGSGLGGKREVSPATVRHWEEGQPPMTTAELEALLRVMRRHWLTDREVADFRKTVFAATASRQYSDLFETGGFAQRRDVEGAAEAVLDREWVAPCSVNVVHLVVLLEELRTSLNSGAGMGVSGAQLSAQRRAFAMLLGANAGHAGFSGRRHVAVACSVSLQRIAEACYGANGLQQSPLRTSVAWLRAHEYFDRCHVGQGPIWAERLLSFAEATISSRDPYAGITFFCMALHCLSEQPSLRFEWDTFRPLIDLRLSRAVNSGNVWNVINANGGLFWAAVNAREWDAAERALEPCGLQPVGFVWEVGGLEAAGSLALAQGHVEEAEGHFTAGLAIARQHNMGLERLLAGLDRCRAASERVRSPG